MALLVMNGALICSRMMSNWIASPDASKLGDFARWIA